MRQDAVILIAVVVLIAGYVAGRQLTGPAPTSEAIQAVQAAPRRRGRPVPALTGEPGWAKVRLAMSWSNLLERVLDKQSEAVRIRSQAMRPILGILALTTATTTCLMLWGPFWLQIAGLVLFSVALVAALCAFVFFAVTDPDRLGSEAHVQRSRVFSAMEKAKNPKFAAMAAVLTSDTNPPLHRAEKALRSSASTPLELPDGDDDAA